MTKFRNSSYFADFLPFSSSFKISDWGLCCIGQSLICSIGGTCCRCSQWQGILRLQLAVTSVACLFSSLLLICLRHVLLPSRLCGRMSLPRRLLVGCQKPSGLSCRCPYTAGLVDRLNVIEWQARHIVCPLGYGRLPSCRHGQASADASVRALQTCQACVPVTVRLHQ